MITDTSIKAYLNEIAPTLQPRCIQVLEVFERIGGDLSNMEIAQALGWSINRVTGRVTKLKEMHVLVEASPRPCKITGRMIRPTMVSADTTVPVRTTKSAPIFYQLPSRSHGGEMHLLKDTNGKLTCSCKGFQFRRTCKHVEMIDEKQDPGVTTSPLFV